MAAIDAQPPPPAAVYASLGVTRSFDGIRFHRVPEQLHPGLVRDALKAEALQPGRIESWHVRYYDERGRRIGEEWSEGAAVDSGA